MCAGQSQDGKGVPSGSGFELSELMKRRLESVASTGSSASSGFIEDKSYCDSEEEEEGKGWARLASLPHPPSVCASCCPPPRLCSTPPTQERQLPSDCFLRLTLMGRFLLLFTSTIAAAGATVTPLSPGRQLFISCPDPTVALLWGFSSAALSAGVLFLVWLAVYSGGPVEGLLGSSSLISSQGLRFTWHKKSVCFFLCKGCS